MLTKGVDAYPFNDSDHYMIHDIDSTGCGLNALRFSLAVCPQKFKQNKYIQNSAQKYYTYLNDIKLSYRAHGGSSCRRYGGGTGT